MPSSDLLRRNHGYVSCGHAIVNQIDIQVREFEGLPEHRTEILLVPVSFHHSFGGVTRHTLENMRDFMHQQVRARMRHQCNSAVFLDSACDGDSELRGEVERLLNESDDSLHSPASGLFGGAPEFAPGDKVAHYRIQEKLGEGGMGVVYKASDSRLGRSVALKFVKTEFGSRGPHEAQAVAALNHPNICTLHDVGPNYLVMELIEGPTLAERIAKGPIPIPEALDIARQISEALEAAHEKGIVHRDLKPADIKLTADGKVKVLDFGLAKAHEPIAEDSPALTVPQTSAGMILGTAAYMSPEQPSGKPVDKRADICRARRQVADISRRRAVWNLVQQPSRTVLRADEDSHYGDGLYGERPIVRARQAARLVGQADLLSRKLKSVLGAGRQAFRGVPHAGRRRTRERFGTRHSPVQLFRRIAP
jgi:predicted Ser/Thr protein kinase